MSEHPFRPLFVEVLRAKPRGGAADLSSLAYMFKTLYAARAATADEMPRGHDAEPQPMT